MLRDSILSKEMTQPWQTVLGQHYSIFTQRVYLSAHLSVSHSLCLIHHYIYLFHLSFDAKSVRSYQPESGTTAFLMCAKATSELLE